jgi:hypothetical protein
MAKVIILSACALALAGCGLGEGIGSWRDAAVGLVTEDEFASMEHILESAEDTPGKQGLLYTATVDAEAASQSASRAVVFSDQPAVAASALGNVVYAIEPVAAPDWDTMASGLVPGWNGTGYGLIRASEEMAAILRGPGGNQGDAAAVDAALICVENTSAWAREASALAQSILVDVEAEDRATLLPQLERLARGLLNGLDANGNGEIEVAEGECGLQQAKTALANHGASAAAG